MPRIYTRRSIDDRFWEKVAVRGEADCWPWIASLSHAGYGQMVVDGKHWIASRLSWTLTRGPIPDGLRVLHRCDNPACVNPAHLWLGTMAENQADMANKGRAMRGERHHTAKITEADVRTIRAEAASGAAHVELARRFGLAPSTVCQIVKRLRWRHVA